MPTRDTMPPRWKLSTIAPGQVDDLNIACVASKAPALARGIARGRGQGDPDVLEDEGRFVFVEVGVLALRDAEIRQRVVRSGVTPWRARHRLAHC
jgi:hypothetical protein